MKDDLKLFSKESLLNYFTDKKDQIKTHILNYKMPVITDPDDYTKKIIAKNRVDSIIVNFTDSRTEYRKAITDPNKVFISVKIPFSGDKKLFYLCPPDFPEQDLPYGRVGTKFLILNFNADINTPNEKHTECLKVALSNLESCIWFVNKEVESFNAWLDQEIRAFVEERIEKNRRLKDTVDSFRII